MTSTSSAARLVPLPQSPWASELESGLPRKTCTCTKTHSDTLQDQHACMLAEECEIVHGCICMQAADLPDVQEQPFAHCSQFASPSPPMVFSSFLAMALDMLLWCSRSVNLQAQMRGGCLTASSKMLMQLQGAAFRQGLHRFGSIGDHRLAALPDQLYTCFRRSLESCTA